MQDYEYYNHFEPTGSSQPGGDLRGCLTHMVALIVAILLCILTGIFATSCRTSRSIPRAAVVERAIHDTLIITRNQRDSILVHDSTHVRELRSNDTVFVEVQRWRIEYRDRLRRDSIYVALRDTVPAPYPVEVSVPRSYTRWDVIRFRMLYALLGLLVAYVFWCRRGILLRWILKIVKK